MPLRRYLFFFGERRTCIYSGWNVDVVDTAGRYAGVSQNIQACQSSCMHASSDTCPKFPRMVVRAHPESV